MTEILSDQDVRRQALLSLLEPFPDEQIGLLPRVTCPDCSNPRKKCDDPRHKKQRCNECNAYVSPKHIHIDYVGHGATTDRLLSVDPEWNWEPCGYDPNGMPAFIQDKAGNPIEFWIRLTVAGVTRLGVGTCPSDQFDPAKVLIGDALRNAAMRFGVALDLWIKGHAEDDEKATAGQRRQAPDPTGDPVKLARILATVNGLPQADRDRVRGWVESKGFPDHPRKLNDTQADQVLVYLEATSKETATDEPV